MFELFFLMNMIKICLTDFLPFNQRVPVRNFQQIVMNYVNNGFFMDLLCNIPICLVIKTDSDNELIPFLYLIKLARFKSAVKILDEKQWSTFMTEFIR